MNALTQFKFQSHQLRVEVDDHGNPWFCAKDVCTILGYSNHNKAIKDHCKSQGCTKNYPLQTAGGVQYPLFISEGNLYRLIIRSHKPEAEVFESWVVDDILSTIRKTGSYGLPHDSKTTIQALQTELLKARPRMAKVLKLQNAGFSKAESGRMLGFGETTIRKEVALLKDCGFKPAATGTQLDLFGGE